MPGVRKERLEELLRREISDIVHREVKDPRIGFVTITDAEVTRDLSFAKVFVSVLGTMEEQEATLKGLNSATRFIRTEFGRRIKLRLVPEISFRFDTSIQQGARIHELLEQVKREEGGLGDGSHTDGQDGQDGSKAAAD